MGSIFDDAFAAAARQTIQAVMAETILYTPASTGAEVSIQATVEPREETAVDTDSGRDIHAEITVVLSLEDVSDPHPDDRLTYAGDEYQVTQINDTTAGMCSLAALYVSEQSRTRADRFAPM